MLCNIFILIIVLVKTMCQEVFGTILNAQGKINSNSNFSTSIILYTEMVGL